MTRWSPFNIAPRQYFNWCPESSVHLKNVTIHPEEKYYYVISQTLSQTITSHKESSCQCGLKLRALNLAIQVNLTLLPAHLNAPQAKENLSTYMLMSSSSPTSLYLGSIISSSSFSPSLSLSIAFSVNQRLSHQKLFL